MNDCWPQERGVLGARVVADLIIRCRGHRLTIEIIDWFPRPRYRTLYSTVLRLELPSFYITSPLSSHGWLTYNKRSPTVSLPYPSPLSLAWLLLYLGTNQQFSSYRAHSVPYLHGRLFWSCRPGSSSSCGRAMGRRARRGSLHEVHVCKLIYWITRLL